MQAKTHTFLSIIPFPQNFASFFIVKVFSFIPDFLLCFCLSILLFIKDGLMPPAETMFCEAVEVVNSNIYSWLCISRYFSYVFVFSISAVTLLREGLQKGEDVYDGQLVATLRTPMLLFSSNKACSTHFSASSVNITCCLPSERDRAPQRIIGCGTRSRKHRTRLENLVFTQQQPISHTASLLLRLNYFNTEIYFSCSLFKNFFPLFGETCDWVTKTKQWTPPYLLIVRFILNLRTLQWQCQNLSY